MENRQTKSFLFLTLRQQLEFGAANATEGSVGPIHTLKRELCIQLF